MIFLGIPHRDSVHDLAFRERSLDQKDRLLALTEYQTTLIKVDKVACDLRTTGRGINASSLLLCMNGSSKDFGGDHSRLANFPCRAENP
jgi:hypothetical protein